MMLLLTRTIAAVVLLLCTAAAASPLLLEHRQSSIPVGQVIFSCTVPGTIAITFDDGPYIYTSSVLDQLGQAGFKGTFFVNGQNYDNINNNADVVRRMYNEGHQIGSHTWSHADLATLDDAGIRNQMTLLETALTGIIGRFPTYMRPPSFSYNAATLSTLASLQYHVIQCDIDTKDYANDSPTAIQTAINNFRAGVDAGGTLSLEHDVHQYTAQTLLPFIVQYVKQKGLRAVTVGECLGDPPANWYRTSRSGGGSNPPAGGGGGSGGGTKPSPDETCGGSNGYTCPTNQCCSQYGWCGTTPDYCSTGCQSAFGTCTGSTSSPPPGGGGGGSGGGGGGGSTTQPTPDQTCGGSTGYACTAGLCCSQYGWCGSSDEYCAAGCQGGFGACR